jgi:hypothetical protein
VDPESFAEARCPYCGEPIEMAVDLSAGSQQYVEDCAVCCRPIEVTLRVDGAQWELSLKRDDE